MKIPEDEVFKLKIEFEHDPRKGKINGGIGVYFEPHGNPFILPIVKKVIRRLIFDNFNYLPISGDPVFLMETAKLVLGKELLSEYEPYIAKQGTIGGTNAVYMWARFMSKVEKKPTIIIGVPTWENHEKIFASFNFKIIRYPHLTKDRRFNIKGFLETLSGNPSSHVLFHGGPTHNPTGINPTVEEWKEIAHALGGTRHKVLFDSAYIGLGNSIDSDTTGVRYFLKKRILISVAVSFSKNMTMYQQRAGALLMFMESKHQKELAEKLLTHIFRLVNSNPAGFGEQIVKTILESKEYTKIWRNELEIMRRDLTKRRQLFLKYAGSRFEYLSSCRGLFALLFLQKKQVEWLKKKNGIYLLSNSRINFGGIALKNISKVVNSINQVVHV